MNGPSVTPAARIVFAVAGGCSCWPPSGSFGVLPHFSYQAKTSEYQAFCSASEMASPSGVFMIKMTYFICCLPCRLYHVYEGGDPVSDSRDSTEITTS